ncbi:ABC transporter permease subunit [Labrys wisconsinensis]|uniref:Oligopeptide transport system permease protein OppC n=1 Tax=Labrys wisconsinensis TaxID=425677 RepID=A0ABU0JPJ4_9HYPH|nr:ABC transporter permease subunit [Labrys wisconsinensis]MDQ0475411.1 oligopeptide transport system permease protein [Labrys wisconsinensis]
MTDAPLVLQPSATRSRSLLQLAALRLRRNLAAMVSLVVFAAVVLICVLGPLVTPHRYDQIFQSYVMVPPSLAPYPKEATLKTVMAQAVERARVRLDAFAVSGSRFTAALAADKPVDPRVTRYVDRANEFEGTSVVGSRDEGRTLLIEGGINGQYFPMGTDQNGRDLFARIMVGGQVSLLVGLLASLVSLVIGVAYGAVSGFAGGRVDNVMMRLVEILYSLPFTFLVILLVVFFGRNFVLIFVAIGAIEWLDMARIVRGQTLSLKRREFVAAAHAMGLSDGAVIARHIIPNTIGPVVVFLTVRIPRIMLLESFLSFLGLGVQEPLTSWGALIAEGANAMQAAPWLLIYPSIFFVATLFSLNFIGDGLRDALDPRDR